MMDPSGELLVMKCHEGVINFAYDEEVGEVPVGFAGDTCIPMEGLCYYSVSRAGAQVTVQFGCWPSTVHQSRAWLGQPECRHEEGRGTVCLCSSELCNLKIPFPELHKPEGTEVQSLLVLCLLFLCVIMICIATFYHCKACKLKTKKSAAGQPGTDLESPAAPPPPPSPTRRCSRIPLLPPDQSDWASAVSSSPPPCSLEAALINHSLLPSSPPWILSSSPPNTSLPASSPPTLLRAPSAPPSVPATRVRNNLAFLLEEQRQHVATLHQGVFCL